MTKVYTSPTWQANPLFIAMLKINASQGYFPSCEVARSSIPKQQLQARVLKKMQNQTSNGACNVACSALYFI